MLLGGPAAYKGKNMVDAHKGMNLTNAHFDAIISHLAATLTELGVSNELIGEAAVVLEVTRSDMLGKWLIYSFLCISFDYSSLLNE